MIIEYHNHTYYIPIINRKQFIVSVWRLTEIKLFSRNVEMFFQEICEKGIEENKKSIAYSLTFEKNDRTLTDEEVNEAVAKVIDTLEKKLGAELRK